MQSLLASQAQRFASQTGQLNQTVLQQLGQMNQTVQKGVENSVQLTSKAQETWSAEVKSSREVLGKIQQQLGEVQQAGRELSSASQALQTVLGGAKTRGGLGEITLERLLADSLPAANFEIQHRFPTGVVVDAVVLCHDKLLQIDENDDKLRESLAGLKKQFDGFGEVYERLGTHLRNAQQSYFDADQKLDRARATLDQTAEGALPEASSKPLEISAKQHS